MKNLVRAFFSRDVRVLAGRNRAIDIDGRRIGKQAECRMTKSSLGVFTETLRGHRASYLQVARSQLGGCQIFKGDLVLYSAPVLFLMADERFERYFLTSILRAILGRRTVGLLFRPESVTRRTSLTQRGKGILLKYMRRIRNIRTISIVPATIRPEIQGIVDGWIFDFQLWDLSEVERSAFSELKQARGCQAHPATALYQEFRRHAGSDNLIVAIGSQNLGKGFPQLAAASGEQALGRWRIAVAGKVSGDQAESKEVVESSGGLVVDRFISDQEIIAAYAAADAIWCFYDPSYDQASGILGRAAQFGIPVIVREGSFSADFCRSEGILHVAIRAVHDLPVALAKLPPSDPDFGRQLSEKFRRESLSRLGCAIGMEGMNPGVAEKDA